MENKLKNSFSWRITVIWQKKRQHFAICCIYCYNYASSYKNDKCRRSLNTCCHDGKINLPEHDARIQKKWNVRNLLDGNFEINKHFRQNIKVNYNLFVLYCFNAQNADINSGGWKLLFAKALKGNQRLYSKYFKTFCWINIKTLASQKMYGSSHLVETNRHWLLITQIHSFW